jgi:hypothetical protein
MSLGVTEIVHSQGALSLGCSNIESNSKDKIWERGYDLGRRTEEY